MKITIDIDEQDIIKSALAGLNKDEIKRKVSKDVIDSVIEQLTDNVRSKVWDIIRKDEENYFRENIIKLVHNGIKKEYSPSNVIKMFKKDEWIGFMEDVVQPIMVGFVETALSDWLTIGVTIKGKKKDEFVELAGIDSYTHRKK